MSSLVPEVWMAVWKATRPTRSTRRAHEMMLRSVGEENAERWSQSEQPHDCCIRCRIKEAKAYEIDVGLVEIEYPYWQSLNWAAIEVKSNEYLSFKPRATLSPGNLKREGMD